MITIGKVIASLNSSSTYLTAALKLGVLSGRKYSNLSSGTTMIPTSIFPDCMSLRKCTMSLMSRSLLAETWTSTPILAITVLLYFILFIQSTPPAVVFSQPPNFVKLLSSSCRMTAAPLACFSSSSRMLVERIISCNSRNRIDMPRRQILSLAPS